jgi:flagellar protein FlaG
MADQMNPLSSLASGLPSALLAAAAPRPVPEKPRPAKTADSQPPGRPGAVPAAMSTAAMEQLNGYLHQTGSELQFQVDEGTGRTFFKIVNETTGEVLLQVPSEEMLAMARKLRELEKRLDASGVLMDKEG